MVRDIADLYRLTVDDIKQLEGFADKSSHKLHRAIQDTKKPRLDRFLYALGIRHVGQRMARTLAQKYQTLKALRVAKRKDLREIPDIGPEIAASVADFFQQEENKAVLERLAEVGLEVQKMPAPQSLIQEVREKELGES
jgi:DNA ligase (NAD+)